jgi:hypothetical protein
MAFYVDHKRRWWKKGEDEPHKSLFEWVNAVEQRQSSRRERNRNNLSQFLNRNIVGLSPGELNQYDAVIADLTLNIVQSAVTTVASKLCTQRPHPFVLTENGKFEDQERAKYLQKFIKGVMSQNDIHDSESPRAFMDAMIFDLGAMKCFRREGRIIVERVMPDEIIVDEDEAHTAKPRNLAQKKYITKDVLMEAFPKFVAEISTANTIYNHATNDLTDLVEVVEAWHLKGAKNAQDGKHIIAIKNATLVLEDWKRSRFPFTFMRWGERQVGFYGQGLVEILAPMQREINAIMQRIQESMRLLAVAWVIVDKNSGINKRHLKNVNAIILEKGPGGQAPQVQLNAGVNPQVFEYLDYLYQRAYEIAGVSQLSAHAKKPEGVRSGAALRTLLDTESTRWGMPSRQWERAHVDIARLIIDEAREAAAAGEELAVNCADREWIERIDFAKCNMDDDRFTIDVHPTSSLPTTPAGKLALVEELNALGAIQDPTVALDLLQLPDVEKYTDIETAPLRSAHQICEHILSGDDNWIPPEEFMNLQLCITVANKYWVKGHIEKVPQARLDSLARWIKEAMDIINPAPMPPPPGETPQDPAAMMGPEAMPAGMDAGPAPPGAVPPEVLAALGQ